MARVIYGDVGDFNTICFGMPDPNTRKFLDEQWNTNRSYFTDDRFINNVDNIINSYQSSDILTRARAILKSTGSLLEDPNRIYKLETLDDFQTATPAMQRWVMANPMARELAKKQLIYGYAQTYVDADPNSDGDLHYDYRRAIDGLINIYGNTSDQSVLYLDNIMDGDRQLTLDEQLDIYDTWKNLEYFLTHTNEDPTNIYGGTR